MKTTLTRRLATLLLATLAGCADDGSREAGPVSDAAAAIDGDGTHDSGDPRREPIIPEPSEACPDPTDEDTLSGIPESVQQALMGLAATNAASSMLALFT
jgi:hypothetical protein